MKFKFTIGGKIISAMIAIILLTAVLLAALTFPKFEAALANNTKNQLMDQVANEAETITGIVEGYNSILRSFDRQESAVDDLRSGRSNVYQDILKRTQEEAPALTDIVLLDASGKVMDCIDSTSQHTDYSKEPAVIAVLNQDLSSAQSNVVNAGNGNESVMTVIPIEDNGKIIGAMVGYISYEVFDSAMRSCTVTGINQLAAYIMDQNGTIFGHTEDNKVGTMVQNSVILNVVERLAAGEDIERDGVSYQYKGDEKFAGYYVVPDNNWIICFSVSESEIIGPVKKVENNAYLIILLQCLITCLLVFSLTRLIVKPIRVTNVVLNQLSKLDFQTNNSYRSYARRKDETGEMCASICAVTDNLRDEMLHINGVSENLTSTAHTMKKIAASVTETSEKNLGIISDINERFSSTAATTEQIAQDIKTVQNYTDEMNIKVDESVEKTKSLMLRANSLQDTASEASRKSSAIFDQAKKDMASAMEQAKSVEKISLFTEAIMTISDRTKLLALNASIEAARAGDAGRGFAVVADQIKDLAAQSTESANSIGVLVDEIYQAVNGLENCLQQSLSYIESRVIPDYEHFTSISDAYSQDANILSQTMNFLKAGIDEFGSTMQMTVSSVVEISQNIKDSAVKVEHMEEENRNITQMISQTFEQVNLNSQLSKELKAIVGKYSL